MRQKTGRTKERAENIVRDIRRATRRRFSAEDKIRIVLDGLRGEDSIAELCRREGIAQSLYYSWSKEFLEAGKKRLAGDTAREASTGEVKELRREARRGLVSFIELIAPVIIPAPLHLLLAETASGPVKPAASRGPAISR